MSKGVASSTPPKKDKEKKQKDKKKKEGWHLYSLFKKSKGFDRNVSAIPPIVREPIEWLYSHNALGEEGIFRIPGSATEIKELKIRYDKGKKVDLETILNIHTVAGLLKVFFRELPEPLLTFELYEAFLAAIKPDSLPMRLEYLGRVLEALPAGNKVILEHLMAFLFEVSTHKTNCMSIPNIAIVFAPNLMRPREERIEAILANSSTVNLIISLLIQHHEVLFHGKEFADNENSADPILTPQLISLKMAQSLHSKNGSSTSVGSTGSAGSATNMALPTPSSAAADAEKPPVSPRGGASKSTTTEDKKVASSRKGGDKPMKRSQTVSAGSSTSPHIDFKSSADPKKKLKREKSASPDGDIPDISAADLNSAALALNLNAASLTPTGGSPVTTPTSGKSLRPKKKKTGRSSASNSLRDDIFLDTLKKGTMRLAANLLEEQELVLEMAELEGLSPEEREQLQQKLAKKITESKSLRDNSRKQRQVQRSQTNFTRLMDQQKAVDSSHKRSASSTEERRLLKKSSRRNGTASSAEVSSAVSAQTHSTGSSEAPSLPDSEVSSVADPELEMDPAMMQFEDELDRQLSMEEDNPLIAESDSESLSDSADYELLHATLPPPLPLPVLPTSSSSSAPASPLPVSEEEEERVAEAVMEGDMAQLQEYIGSMRRKKRLDRSLSNKKILSRMSISMSSGTLPQQ